MNADLPQVRPSVPGVGRFAWLLFIKPRHFYELLQLWEMERDPPILSLLRRARSGDKCALLVSKRAVILLLAIAPALSCALLLALKIGAAPTNGPAGLAGAVLGIGFGLVFTVVQGTAFGTALGLTLGPGFGICFAYAAGGAEGQSFGWSFGAAFSIVGAIALSFALSSLLGVSFSATGGLTSGLGLTIAFATLMGSVIAVGMSFSHEGSVVYGFVFLIVFLVFLFELPIYLAEVGAMLLMAALPRWGALRYSALVPYLPYRCHELIYFPLPGLRIFLIDLAMEDSALSRSLIAEAAASLGQKRPARLALLELQARELERVARERLFLGTSGLHLPFLSTPSELSSNFLSTFKSAAGDLIAASTSRNHLHRGRTLARARKTLEGLQLEIAALRRLDTLARRRLKVLEVWLDLIDREREALKRDATENPQVPTPFVAGPPLRPDERSLFKGREDLVRIIDHDLVGEGRAPILVVGQRRMGKSSLINMLPTFLGEGTVVVKVDFQGLSGWPNRSHPHLGLLQKIFQGTSLSQVPPPAEEAWAKSLEWLVLLDELLRLANRRMLVTLDEVERLQDGIEAGWAGIEFLDFLRAASDSLSQIRFLLASAYSLPRLGPHWTDRLINALQRRIHLLDEAAARSLMASPIPGFPNIYPAGGVDMLWAETQGHPFLIQLVCDSLCRSLNEQKRLQGTLDDLKKLLDTVADETSVFNDLWRQQNEAERFALQRLAVTGTVSGIPPAVLKVLENEGFLRRQGETLSIAVPLFARWIREQTGGSD